MNQKKQPMRRTVLPIILLVASIFQLSAQSGEAAILIQPYLQDATPNSIKIAWETSSGEESLVEYGTTPKLGQKAKGIAFDVNFSSSRIHEVKISGLERFTSIIIGCERERQYRKYSNLRRPLLPAITNLSM